MPRIHTKTKTEYQKRICSGCYYYYHETQKHPPHKEHCGCDVGHAPRCRRGDYWFCDYFINRVLYEKDGTGLIIAMLYGIHRMLAERVAEGGE